MSASSTIWIPASIDMSYEKVACDPIKVGNSSATQFTVRFLAIGVEYQS